MVVPDVITILPEPLPVVRPTAVTTRFMTVVASVITPMAVCAEAHLATVVALVVRIVISPALAVIRRSATLPELAVFLPVPVVITILPEPPQAFRPAPATTSSTTIAVSVIILPVD